LTNDHLKARAAHLVLETPALDILNVIFPTETERRRREEDEKRLLVVVPNLWNQLAKDFFNNPTWDPKNADIADNVTNYIDPSHPPSPPFSGSQLRALYHFVRSQYSLASNHLRESHTLNSASPLSNDEAMVYTDESPLMAYIDRLYSSLPWLPCMRERASLPIDSAITSLKRKSSGWPALCVKAALPSSSDQPMESSRLEQAAVARDAAVEDYYRQAARLSAMHMHHAEVRFLEEQIRKDLLEEPIRQVLLSKLNKLLMEGN
jgi:hypothetical protein